MERKSTNFQITEKLFNMGESFSWAWIRDMCKSALANVPELFLSPVSSLCSTGLSIWLGTFYHVLRKAASPARPVPASPLLPPSGGWVSITSREGDLSSGGIC